MRRSTGLAGLAVLAMLLLPGCSSDDDTAAATAAPAASVSPAGTSAPAASTPPASGANAAALADAVDFTDPEGFYTITVSSAWKQLKSDQKKEYWALGGESGGFTPTLRLVGAPVSGILSALSPEQYMDLSVQILQTAGLTLVKDSIIPGVNTPNLGLIEYTGKLAPDQPVTHSVDVFDLSETTVVTATLTVLPDDFEKFSSAIVPYLSTLKVTG